MSAPDVSVVIPSGRGARLAFALEALAQQTLPRERFEVVIVRDLGAATTPPPPPELAVRFLPAPARGNIATMRNAGWREASARYVAFTDDDCRPHPRWLERLLASAAGADVIVQGRTEPDPDEVHLLHGLARSQRIAAPSPWYQTCNILYSRELLAGLDGFDERFGQLGEDADLGLRARARGARRVYEHDALVWHAVLPRSLFAAIREALRRDTMPALIARHPGQRRHLYARVFWRRSHALLALALAGAAMAPRHRAAALAAVPYARRVLAPDGAGGGPRAYVRRAMHAPAKVLVDGVELGVVARSSWRHRTFLL